LTQCRGRFLPGVKGVDELFLSAQGLRERNEFFLARGRTFFRDSQARALALELVEHVRHARTPLRQRFRQAFAQGFDRYVLFNHGRRSFEWKSAALNCTVFQAIAWTCVTTETASGAVTEAARSAHRRGG